MGTCEFSSQQSLDDGDELALRLTIKKGRATLDFRGTAPTRKDNLNATEAIVTSAVCYCLRLLIGKDLPLNEGLLEPVDLIIPEGSLLHPSFPDDPDHCPGVAGGNVEVSQRIVDLILSAFGRVACSQGTMNNLTFGNASFSHYETIGGGAGATIGQEGTSAVQVHMTNTAITDPEILESRFPVRLLGFCKRTGSGGKGSWNGGEGIERHYLFEEEIELSLLTQRRTSGPDGLCGGEAGQPGEQILIRSDGTEEILNPTDSRTAYPGDRLILRTPGGGGAGEPELLA
jgi:5-oxoprolinase (ATP-hydrolysing)